MLTACWRSASRCTADPELCRHRCTGIDVARSFRMDRRRTLIAAMLCLCGGACESSNPTGPSTFTSTATFVALPPASPTVPVQNPVPVPTTTPVPPPQVANPVATPNFMSSATIATTSVQVQTPLPLGAVVTPQATTPQPTAAATATASFTRASVTGRK